MQSGAGAFHEISVLDHHFIGEVQFQYLRRFTSIDCDLQIAGRADQTYGLSQRHGLIIRVERADRLVMDENSPAPSRMRSQVGAMDVGNGIAEAIDMDDLPPNAAVARADRLWPWQPQIMLHLRPDLREWHPLAQMCGHRRKNVPAMKCLADRPQEKVFISQPPHLFDGLLSQGPREHAIVRPDKKIIRRLHRNRATITAHPWVHYRYMDCLGREIAATGRQGKGRRANFTSGNIVRDIHHLNPWRDAEDNAFYGANKPIVRSKVGG